MTTKDYSKPQWFLIYTKPRQEERAKKNLENQGYKTFLPMIAYEKKSQLKSFSLKPMFPRYLFIIINVKKDNWAQIKSTRGVSHFVLFESKLAEVPDSVMAFLKARVDRNDIVKQRITCRKFRKGEELIIKKGALKGRKATFLSETGKERVRILLELMNKMIIAEVSRHNVSERRTIIETFKF